MDSNVVILFIIMFPFVYITFVILHHNSVSVWDWNVFPVTELGIRYSIDQSQIFTLHIVVVYIRRTVGSIGIIEIGEVLVHHFYSFS